MKTKQVITIIAIILVSILIVWLGFGYYQKAFVKVQNPIATMEIEGYGTVKIELYPDMAPNTVANFINLANRGYYNGLTFHRTIPDFMIQGGDKAGDGTGSVYYSDLKDDGEEKAYTIKGEFIANGFKKNTLRHEEGVISMARGDYSTYGLTTEGYNSAGSQFFIMTGDNSSLNGLYSAFGKVIEGMDIIEKISKVEVKKETTNKGKKNEEENTAKTPKKEIKISKVTVDTKGEKYNAPEVTSKVDFDSLFSQLMSSMQSSNN